MAAAGDEAAGSGEVGGQEQRGLHCNGQPGRAPDAPTESMDEGKGGAAAAADAERGRGHQARGFYGLPISFSGQFKALGENGERPALMSAQKSPAGQADHVRSGKSPVPLRRFALFAAADCWSSTLRVS